MNRFSAFGDERRSLARLNPEATTLVAIGEQEPFSNSSNGFRSLATKAFSKLRVM